MQKSIGQHKGHHCFTGYATSYSKTQDSLARAQVTNSSLFALPGGDAGIALVVEGGHQSWEYKPDSRFLDGSDDPTYLYTSVAGDGRRNRYAGTTELRLPVLQQVTIDLSGRYDDVVYVFDTDSGAVSQIPVGQEPHGLTVWPQPGRYSLGHTGNMR